MPEVEQNRVQPTPDTCPPGSACEVAYGSKEYKEKRGSLLATISKSTLLSTVKGNSGLILQALTTTAVAAIAVGAFHVGGWAIAALVAGVVAVNAVGAIAGFLDERMSRTANLNFSEARQIADARLNAKMQGQEMAVAMDDTIGRELREANAESRKSRESIEEMRREMKTWQERVQNSTHPISTQIH